jgi:hypothetical protein
MINGWTNTREFDTSMLRFEKKQECLATIEALDNIKVQGTFEAYSPLEDMKKFCVEVKSSD